MQSELWTKTQVSQIERPFLIEQMLFNYQGYYTARDAKKTSKEIDEIPGIMLNMEEKMVLGKISMKVSALS